MTQPPALAIPATEAAGLFAPLAGKRLLVGWSGGPDSTALVGLLAAWAPGHAAQLTTATVDHGLREGSRAEAESVGRLARQLGVAHRILSWDGAKPAAGIQEAAREARYRLMAEEARRTGADTLVTAHTRDDQAETILMRLARGSGLDGLRGMRALTTRHGLVLARPLLALAKARLVATCAAHGWPFVSDPLNGDPRFARARWRRLMPLLAAEGLTPERLTAFGGRAGAAQDALVAWGNDLIAIGTPEQLDLSALRDRPPAVLTAWLMQRLARDADLSPPPALARCEAMAKRLIAALQSGDSLRATLAGQLIALDRRGVLTIRPEPPRRRGRPQGDGQAS